MAWSYGGDPTISPLDAVRFEIGDTDPQYPLLQDEEIQYTITIEPSTLAAAARCCEVLARKFSMEPNTSIGRTKVDAATMASNLRELAKDLRKQANATNAQFFAGGIVEPYFVRGIHDNND